MIIILKNAGSRNHKLSTKTNFTMKNKIILAGSGIVAAAMLLVSCEKQRDKEVALENLNFTNTSQVQIYNAMVGSLRNYAYVDANTLNGATIGYATTFPSTP